MGKFNNVCASKTGISGIEIPKHCLEWETIYGILFRTGTGTPIGDPTEANALGAFFSNNKSSKRRVYIGSVKSNLGHLESAAGIAGLIKILLMMKNGAIVPSLMYTKEKENPKIDFEGYGFVVPTKCVPWPKPQNNVRTACVNSFGFGGTNAHAIIQDYQTKLCSSDNKTKPPFVVTVSAFNHDSLKENINCLMQDLQNNQVNLPSLAFTSTCKRDHKPERKAFLFETKEQLTDQCRAFSMVTPTKRKRKPDKSIVFVFCGVGTLWNGVGKAFLTIPAFSEAMKSIDSILQPLAGWCIRRKFERNEELLSDPLISHISMFACQIGIAAVWESFGIRPNAVVGQSVGEVAACYVAGKIDLASAVKIIFYRSKLLSETKGGAMLFVNKVPVEQIEAYCKTNAGKVNIAVYNSPVSCTVSGDKNVITSMKSELQQHPSAADTVVLDLNVACAYHSHYVDSASNRIVGKLNQIKGQNSDIAVFSTVSGKQEQTELFTTGNYWAENIRKPVLFNEAIQAATSIAKTNLFIEIGPGPVLRVHTPAIFDDSLAYDVLPSSTKDKALETILQTTCKLYEHGCSICWNKIITETKNISAFPKYVFWKQKTLQQNPSILLRNQGIDVDEQSHLYLERLADSDGCPKFNAKINNETTPFVFEHFVKGNILVPGALHADVGLEIGIAGFGLPYKELSVSLEFLRTIRLEKQSQQILSITSSRDDGCFSFYIKHGQSIMSKGNVRKLKGCEHPPKVPNLAELKQRIQNGTNYTHDEFYSKLKILGFEYGNAFHIIQTCTSDDKICLATCELPPEVMSNVNRTVLHPCILDSLLQTTMAMLNNQASWELVTEEKLALLPVAVESIKVINKPQQHMFIYTKATNASVMDTVFKLHFNSILFDMNGNTVAEIINYTTYSKRTAQNAPDDLRYNLTWHRDLPTKMFEKKKILCITNDFEHTGIEADMKSNNTIVCSPESSTVCFDTFVCRSTNIAMEQWGSKENIDAIIVAFDGHVWGKDLNSQNIEAIYQQTKNNCWLIVSLIRHLVYENLRRPMFVVTQNTQTSQNADEERTKNVVGSEVWGFVRSLQTEFVYGQITLVDVQPSLEESKPKLWEFVHAAVENLEAYNTEVIINQEKIYSSAFSKCSPVSPTPYFKRMTIRPDEEFSARSKTANYVSDPFVLYGEKQGKPEKALKNSIYMRIKSVYLHPTSIYSATTATYDKSFDVWDDCESEGHQITGIELVGYQLDAHHTGRLFQCGSSQIDTEVSTSENKWECIAVYPVEVLSVVRVPKDCTISMKELPFYQHGLLLTSILAWNITENISSFSTVVVKVDERDSFTGNVIKEMLLTRKKVKIVHENCEEKCDVVISLCKQESDYTTLGRAKMLVCLKHAIPADVYRRLMINDKVDIKEIEPTNILTRETIAKLLKQCVPWLQKHFYKLREKYTTDLQNNGERQLVDPKTIELSCLTSMIQQDRVFDKTGTYMISGGLTGLGWELLQLIAGLGAGTIVTLGRRGVNAEKQKEIDEIQQKYSCKIVCLQTDVTDYQSVQRAVATLDKTRGIGRIKGVFHGAGALDSSLLMNITQQQLENVMKPKILGTLNTHVATLHHQLDYFVLQSSITSFIGSPGQSNYGAGNSFMDAFANWRRSKGLQAQSINWGALSVGMAANTNFVENFEKRGFYLLSVPEIRCCFMQAIMQNSTAVVYASLDWRLVAKDFSTPHMSRIKKKVDTVISEQVSGGFSSSDDDIISSALDIEKLRQADENVQREVMELFVQGIVSRVLQNEVETYAMSSTVSEIGLDSMSSLTFTNIVYDLTRYRIDARFFYEQERSLNDIVTYLIENLIRAQETHGTRTPELAPVDV